MACNRICRVNIHMDTMSTRVISALQIICLCGSGWLCPHHVLQLTVTLSFFVTDKSSVWGGSFWPISRSPIKRNSEFFMYRALFSYPIFCDVFRIGVLGLEIVLAHTWPTVVSTRCYSIFKEHGILWRNCGGSVQISFHLYTASKIVNLSRDFNFFGNFEISLYVGRQRKRLKPATKSKNIL